MSRISIESGGEYLSRLLRPYELSELPVCDRLEYESSESDESSDGQKYIPISYYAYVYACSIDHQYRRRHHEHQYHLEHIHLEKTPNDEIPPTPPLLTPSGISCIFSSLFQFSQSDMRDDTGSPEENESRHYDLWKSPIRADERYDCNQYESKTPEYIDDRVISYPQRKEKQENVGDEESKEDESHKEKCIEKLDFVKREK